MKEYKWSHSVMSNSLQHYGLYPTRVLSPWNFPGKSTGVGCRFLLQGIFPTQGLNLGLLHCRQTHYHLSHQGSRHYIDMLALFTKFIRDVLGHMPSCIEWKCNINVKNYKAVISSAVWRKGPLFSKIDCIFLIWRGLFNVQWRCTLHFGKDQPQRGHDAIFFFLVWLLCPRNIYDVFSSHLPPFWS